ncbi:MAG: histidine kinase [Lachnospiraceae bacterium]|nr:histidine kinase [Lachnospiraceae bacterium]
MIKKIENLSLNKKFLIITSIIVLVALGIPSAILYQYYYKTFSPMINESFEMAAQNSADNMSKIIENCEKAAKGINNNEDARLSATSSSLTVIADTIINFEVAEGGANIKTELERYHAALDYFEGMLEITCGIEEEGYVGQLLVCEEYPLSNYLVKWNVSKNSTISSFVSGSEIEQEIWYRKTMEKEGDFYWFVEEERPDNLVAAKLLTYQQLTRNNKFEEKNLGILLISIDLDMLREELNTQGMTFETYSYVTKENDILVEINNNEVSGTEINISDAELQELFGDLEDGESARRSYQGKAYYVQRNKLPQGMHLCTLIPVYDIQMMDIKAFLVCLGLIFAIFCMVMIALRILNCYFVKPVIKLSERMRKRELDYKADAEICARMDEIGALYREYAAMQEKIQELIGQVWKEAEEKRKKEVMALQMQINPHFIFNTLGTLSCYALMEGQDQFAKQLSTLSSILRYYTRNPEKIVPLREELNMIKQYEELQQMTRKDSLIFKYCIDKECEDFMIPKLIIQPLVENAILYGAPKDGSSHEIEISAGLFRENELVVVVRDSGCEADVEWINRYVSGQCEKESKRESFGIRNVYERLELIFGEKGLLIYRKDEKGRTMAIVRILMEQD